MAKLTIKEREALTPADIGRTVRDGDGLSGRVRANARAEGGVSVTFTYRYRWEGKYRNEPCGSWPRDKITAIRDKRDKVRQSIDEKVDPVEARQAKHLKVLAEQAEQRQRKAEADALREAQEAERLAREAERLAEAERERRRLTVQQLFERWAGLVLSGRKDGGAETRRGFAKDVMPVMGTQKAADITRADVMAVLDTVKARGANRLANRLLAELRQMFDFALVREIVTANPTNRIEKKDAGGKDKERERVLSEAELRALPARLAGANLLRSTEHAIWVMLATCCRIGELSGARLDDIDLAGRIWFLPDTKNGKPHTVYLSEFAARHLEQLVALVRRQNLAVPGGAQRRRRRFQVHHQAGVRPPARQAEAQRHGADHVAVPAGRALGPA
ncbi:Phage integrase (fragment) [Cupriavidus taiwanensis]|uniref:Phage integrase n=1 Tax=Cupriavidus taiwanensis TaxID=164546 RepID=A0A375ICY8_9BURK